MIHSLLPTDPAHATREDETCELPADATCFRELIRTTSVEDATSKTRDEDEMASASSSLPPPSPFALIQRDQGESGDLKPVKKSISQPVDEQLLSATLRKKVVLGAQVHTPYVSFPAANNIPQASSSPISTHLEVIQAIAESTFQEITHVYKHEIQETTLTLDGPRFVGTPLEGVKLIIREYSTAPRMYNVCFACAPAGLAYLQPHLATFKTFFQNRKLPFSIHSIEADLGDGIPAPIEQTSDSQDDQEREESRG